MQPKDPGRSSCSRLRGCNSCPPADAYLGLLGEANRHRRPVLPYRLLGLHRLEGPIRVARTTDRQRAYARVLKQRYVYTPEMVVDGIGTTPVATAA